LGREELDRALLKFLDEMVAAAAGAGKDLRDERTLSLAFRAIVKIEERCGGTNSPNAIPNPFD
jgi:hypothetical protein